MEFVHRTYYTEEQILEVISKRGFIIEWNEGDTKKINLPNMHLVKSELHQYRGGGTIIVDVKINYNHFNEKLFSKEVTLCVLKKALDTTPKGDFMFYYFEETSIEKMIVNH